MGILTIRTGELTKNLEFVVSLWIFSKNRQFGTDVAPVFGDFPWFSRECFYGLVVFLVEFWWFYSCFLWFQCAFLQYSDRIYVTKRFAQHRNFSAADIGNRLGEIHGNPQFLTGVNSDPKLTAMLIKYSVHMYISSYLIAGLEHFYDFSFSWECHKPNWRTPWFFRGVEPPTRLHNVHT